MSTCHSLSSPDYLLHNMTDLMVNTTGWKVFVERKTVPAHIPVTDGKQKPAYFLLKYNYKCNYPNTYYLSQKRTDQLHIQCLYNQPEQVNEENPYRNAESGCSPDKTVQLVEYCRYHYY